MPGFLERYRETVSKGFSSDKNITSSRSYEIQKYLEKSGLSSMKPFYQSIDDFDCGRFACNGNKIVGFFCSIVPEEILFACALHPIRLCCEDYNCFQAGEEIASGDICPVVKSICGKFYNKVYDRIDLLIVPGTCDPKTKLAELLSPVKEVYFLDPGRDCEYLKNVDFWEQRYTDLFEFLKKDLMLAPSENSSFQPAKKQTLEPRFSERYTI